jgi:WD40 repeat protein
MSEKRAHSPEMEEVVEGGTSAIVKKQKTDEGSIVGSVTKQVRTQLSWGGIRAHASARAELVPGSTEAASAPSRMQGIKRTSNLLAPIMQLTGHGGEVYSVRFNPDGECLASGSFDKLIYLWKTYGECPNYMVLKVGMRLAETCRARG